MDKTPSRTDNRMDKMPSRTDNGASEDPIQQLSKLTERQRDILRLRCAGQQEDEIAKNLLLSVSTVRLDMRGIYQVCGLSGLGRAKQNQKLFGTYCPAFEEMEARRREPSPKSEEPEAMPEKSEATGAGSRASSPESGESRAIPKGAEKMASDRKGGRRPQPRSSQWVLVVVIALVAILVTAVGYGMRGCLPLDRMTVWPSRVSFFDDFEDGLDPAWQVVSGDYAIVNGRLTTNGGVTLLIGGTSWRDYAIEFQHWIEADRGVVTLLRVQDMDNLVEFSSDYWNSRWFIRSDGTDQEVPHSVGESGNSGYARVKVVVEGNEYRAYLNGNRVSSFRNDQFAKGRIGIILYPRRQIDDFSISPIQ